MHTPSWLSRNWPSMVTTTVTAAGLLFFIGQRDAEIRVRMDHEDIARKEFTAAVNARFNSVETKLSADNSQNVPYRVTVLEQQLLQANQRTDRMYEQITSMFDLLRKDVNSLATNNALLTERIEVLTGRIEAITPGGRKTAMPMRDAVVTR